MSNLEQAARATRARVQAQNRFFENFGFSVLLFAAPLLVSPMLFMAPVLFVASVVAVSAALLYLYLRRSFIVAAKELAVVMQRERAEKGIFAAATLSASLVALWGITFDVNRNTGTGISGWIVIATVLISAGVLRAVVKKTEAVSVNYDLHKKAFDKANWIATAIFALPLFGFLYFANGRTGPGDYKVVYSPSADLPFVAEHPFIYSVGTIVLLAPLFAFSFSLLWKAFQLFVVPRVILELDRSLRAQLHSMGISPSDANLAEAKREGMASGRLSALITGTSRAFGTDPDLVMVFLKADESPISATKALLLAAPVAAMAAPAVSLIAPLLLASEAAKLAVAQDVARYAQHNQNARIQK